MKPAPHATPLSADADLIAAIERLVARAVEYPRAVIAYRSDFDDVKAALCAHRA